jgi:hypothetical protein
VLDIYIFIYLFTCFICGLFRNDFSSAECNNINQFRSRIRTQIEIRWNPGPINVYCLIVGRCFYCCMREDFVAEVPILCALNFSDRTSSPPLDAACVIIDR